MEKATEAREKNEQGAEMDAINLAVVNAMCQNTTNNGLIEEEYLFPELTKIGATAVKNDTGFLATVTKSGRKYTITKTGLVSLNTNNWAKKSAVFVGDSITYGVGTEEGKRYWEFLEDELDFSSVTGRGIAGSCISAKSDYGTNNNPLISRYNTIPNADLICIFMGTNDYGHETPLGTISDTEDVSFYGALNVIIPSIINTHKNSKIVFITPMHRYGFGKSKITGNNFTYDNLPNGLGYTLNDYVEAIKDVCDVYSVPVIDLFSVSELDANNSIIRTTYFPDGLHPNAEGHKIIANMLKENLNNIQPPIVNNTLNTEESEDIELQKGNTYNTTYKDSTNRASITHNIYIKANTIISLKNNTYKYGIYRQTSSNTTVDTNTITGGWTTIDYEITQDGWYGIAFCRVDDTNFDFNNNDSEILSDYIEIKAKKDLLIQKGNAYNTTYKDSTNRASITRNIYIKANTIISLKNNAYKYGIYKQTRIKGSL